MYRRLSEALSLSTMSTHPAGSPSPDEADAQKAALMKLNRFWPGLGLGLSVFASIYAIAVPLGLASLVVARLSAGSGPIDACGYNADTWTWSLLPFGFSCHYSNTVFTGDDAWDGPPVVFHEVNTPAMVIFLIAALIVLVTFAAQTRRAR